jgi:hypothetical protein
MRLFSQRIMSSVVGLALVIMYVGTIRPAQANHCTNCIHNATEQSSGNWYGSAAYIQYRDPNLKSGSWVYHRTAVVHQNPGAAFRYSEIGWQKRKVLLGTEYRGFVVWDSGNNRQELGFSISTNVDHRFHQQYWRDSAGKDRYAWYVDGVGVGNGITNFSYSTAVMAGGETTGLEAMGNTLAYSNQKVRRNSDGTYSNISWGGHTNYVDDPPYTNTNGANSDSFYSTGNE